MCALGLLAKFLPMQNLHSQAGQVFKGPPRGSTARPRLYEEICSPARRCFVNVVLMPLHRIRPLPYARARLLYSMPPRTSDYIYHLFHVYQYRPAVVCINHDTVLAVFGRRSAWRCYTYEATDINDRFCRYPLHNKPLPPPCECVASRLLGARACLVTGARDRRRDH